MTILPCQRSRIAEILASVKRPENVLFKIWWICAVFAILLLFVMLPVMVLVALTSSPSPKGQLDVGKNKPLKYLFGLYVLLVGGFFLLALTTGLVKQSHFF